MDEISFVEKRGGEYVVSIPNAVVDVLKQRKHLPRMLYVHWRRTHIPLYYIVTLGNAGWKNKNTFNEGVTVLPERVVNEIKHEEARANMEATGILWRTSRVDGRTVAFARVLIGYNKTFSAQIENNELVLTPELEYFMNLHVRTRLYWKRVEENTWLITKTPLKDPDWVSWNACNTLELPPFENNAWSAEILLHVINGKPVLLLRRTVFGERVLNITRELVKKEKDIEIHELYSKFIASASERADFEFFLKLLEYLHVISHDARVFISGNPDVPFYIHGGDDNG